MKTYKKRFTTYLLLFFTLHSNTFLCSLTIDIYTFDDKTNRKFFLKEPTLNETYRNIGILDFLTLQGTVFTPYDVTLPYFTLLQTYLLYYNSQIFDLFQRNVSPEVKKICSYISYLGTGWIQIPLFAISYLTGDEKCKKFAVAGVKSFILSGVQVQLYKHLIGNERPWNVVPSLGMSIENDSFPSGHATAIFSFAETYNKVFGQKVYPYGIATLIGIARICEGAHWPADIFAGAYMGHKTADKIYKSISNRNKEEWGKRKHNNFISSHLLWQFDSFCSVKRVNFYGARFKIFSDIYITPFNNFYVKFGTKYNKAIKDGYFSDLCSEIQFLYNFNIYLMPYIRYKNFQQQDAPYKQQIYVGNYSILCKHLLSCSMVYSDPAKLHFQIEYYSTAWLNIKYSILSYLPLVSKNDALPLLFLFMRKKLNLLEVNFMLGFYYDSKNAINTSFEASILAALYRNFCCEVAYEGGRGKNDEITFSWLVKL